MPVDFFRVRQTKFGGNFFKVLIFQPVRTHRAGVQIQKVNRRKTYAQALDNFFTAAVFLAARTQVSNVANENVKNIAVVFRAHKPPVIVHPANRAVLSPNAVLHVVNVSVAVLNLPRDRFFNLVQIVWVNNSMKSIARQLLELLKRLAAENIQHNVVGVQKFLPFVCAVYEKTARHFFRHSCHILQTEINSL